MDSFEKKRNQSDSVRNVPKPSVTSPQLPPHEEQRRHSLDGSIPRKSVSNPSSQSMIIPRKHIPRSSAENSKISYSSTSTIPRKVPSKLNSGSSALSLTISMSRPSLHGAIPRKSNNGNKDKNKKKYAISQPEIDKTSQSMNKLNVRENRPKGQRLSFKIPQGSLRQDKKSNRLPPQTLSTSTGSSSRNHKERKLGRNILSEQPFRILIDLKGVNLSNGGIIQSRAQKRSSTRSPSSKRERKRKQDSQDVDLDDFLTDSSNDDADDDDDDDNYRGRSKKKKSLSKKAKIKSMSSNQVTVGVKAADITASGISAYQQIPYMGPSVTNVGALPATTFLEIGNTSFNSPPAGTVGSLWYSREVFLNTYVVEKILAWRTRTTTQLEWDPESYTAETKPATPPTIDFATAAKYSEMARSCPLIWNDPKKRMEISRIDQQRCPIVIAMGVEAQREERERIIKEKSSALKQQMSIDNNAMTTDSFRKDDHQQIKLEQSQPGNGQLESALSQNQGNHSTKTKATSRPCYRIKQTPSSGNLNAREEAEEVFLIKWRGKSHLHASWERGADIIRMDQSNNTARGKIRKFVQSQELSFGINWKRVLEEERSTASNIHAHADHNIENTVDSSEAIDDEYYPPGMTDIESILACDESEMDISLFAKQRALNIIDDQEEIKHKEKGKIKPWNSKEGLKELLTELPWDPEDNVRYVVKWKSLSFSDITWEYWKDIKKDAANEAEDFWIRQKPPDDAILAKYTKVHPHIKYFRKIQESPVYGHSKRERLIAESVDGQSVPKDDDDEPANAGFRLRSYQLEGVNWLLFNWWNQRSCILADEMGLGKTIQTVGFIKQLQDLPTTSIRGPFLIIAPLSLIGQWQSEMKAWAPDLNVVLYHGSADARDFIIKNEFFYTDQFVSKATANKLRKQHVTKFHILITTYEVIFKDIDVFNKIKWKALIVDEAHRLKNSKAKLFDELLSVPRDFCLLLTGTPIANNTEELWALLHFANRSYFNSKEDFLGKFGQLDNSTQVEELHKILKPYLLRRVKEDVEKSMPPKTETILEVSLTPTQKKFYKAIYERNTTFLFQGAKPSNSPSLMNVVMELRKCCNHPFLIRGVEDRILTEASQQVSPSALDYAKIFEEQLIKSSGKMVLIDKLLPKLFANGHKVLIFSQMVRVLDLLEEYLRLKRYKYERLDGSTRSSSRAAAVGRFIRKSCQRFVMLLSTRAGGLGLNLTAADIVVIFDSDFNPQNDLQAMARAHRIGQTKAVSVYRLVTAKTYEMHMFHSASMKLGLEQAVLSRNREQGEEGSNRKKHKSKSEKEAESKKIDALLKKGAYDVFRDDDDEEAKKFMETDIDQLLNSSKNVTYGNKNNKMNSGLGSFSKASFVTDTGEGEKDVDLDDPDFWSKAVGLDKPIDTPEELSHMIDDGVKRARKQVNQFDPYAELREAELKKQERIEQKLQAEKKERERIREEKKRKKLEEKNRRALNLKESRSLLPLSDSSKRKMRPKNTTNNGEADGKNKFANKNTLAININDPNQEFLPKRSKKSIERKRVLRRAENENPAIENLKQAWDVSHRNRAAAACLRFGFYRFTKIRNESNLQALPIQDIEIFFRSYFYQQSLQLGVLFLEKLRSDQSGIVENDLQGHLLEYLGPVSSKELGWLSDCISQGIQHYLEIENRRRSFRLPLTLMESSYVSELRKGAALRSLRRIYMSSRVERVIGDCVNGIIAELGYEQLGQRGCNTSNLSSLDIDLKSRLLSTEEITVSINFLFKEVNHKAPATWWDRSCDIALILGTFQHGFGNYETMLNDESLPFAYKIRNFRKHDISCCEAQKLFTNVTSAAKKVFDDALDASKLKAQKEVQKAVAAAAAAAANREKEAAALREGGVAADVVMSSMGDQPLDHLYEIKEGRNDHFITLSRIKKAVDSAIRNDASISAINARVEMIHDSSKLPLKQETKLAEESKGRRKRNTFRTLPMPDARILDFRLKLLLAEIDKHHFDCSEDTALESFVTSPKFWKASDTVSINQSMRDFSLRFALGCTDKYSLNQVTEYAGIGLNGTQCGVTHRSLDDRTDFSIGAASPELYQVAHGPESPRYLRALGVPMTFGRFGLVSLAYVDEKCLDYMLLNETRVNRSSGKEIEAKNVQINAITDSTNLDDTVSSGNSILEGSLSEIEPRLPVERNLKSRITPSTFQKQRKYSIPFAFEDVKLRAAVSAVLLYFGYPFVEDSDMTLCHDIWKFIGDTPPGELYHKTRFESLLQDLYGSNKIPGTDIIKEYIEKFFLPHCLKLCLYGNNATTRSSRGSKGEYETYEGTSCYPEPTEGLQSPLPDPCLQVNEQSIEAVGMASAIIRRVRLMQCILKISSGKIPSNNLRDVLNSQTMRKSLDGLPVWWCPLIHDTALLVHSGTRGLFSILKDRESKSECDLNPGFTQASIKQHIRSTFFVEGDGMVPNVLVGSSAGDEISAWVERYAKEFPSMNVIERRLAFLCSELTKKMSDSNSRFFTLPMFDHGGWPRN